MNQADSPFPAASPPRYLALLPAAGVGARMGGNTPKQYMPLAGKPMLHHALAAFARHPRIAHTFVVVSAADGWIDAVLEAAQLENVIGNVTKNATNNVTKDITILRVGGATRQESVLNGLRAIRTNVTDADWILVHDAARPGLDAALIDRLLDTLADDPVGGLLALPVVDTLKQASQTDATRAQQTVPRAGLWAAQTPQMFRYGLLNQALQQACQQGKLDTITDDASAIEMLGLQPRLVEGSPRNLKVTLAQDAALAEFFLKDPR